MKAIIFDSGPLINLALNNLLWILPKLKEIFKGEFYITESVERESITRPMTSKKFKFESLQILKLKEDGVIKIFKHPELVEKTKSLLELSNSLFMIHDNYIKNVQYAEVESLVATNLIEGSACVIDEFITRMLVENSLAVKKRMEKKLHATVNLDRNNLKKFQAKINKITIIRSIELVTIAYEKEFFKDYLLHIQNPKKVLLEGLLWTVKLNGCSVTEKEIETIQRKIL